MSKNRMAWWEINTNKLSVTKAALPSSTLIVGADVS